MSTTSQQRLDKWLWFARVTKTRTAASRLVETGKVRVNRTRTLKPATSVRPDDIITVVVNRQAKVLKVKKTGRRRGPASEAQELYIDLTPPPQAPNTEQSRKPETLVNTQSPARRDPGSGRPTKRDRRKIERFLLRSELRRERRQNK